MRSSLGAEVQRRTDRFALMRIESVFEVPAAPDTAWALLTDVPRVVPCMPGAELERIVDDSTWEVLQRVKLGPISLQFRSEVTRTEMNETERRAVLSVNAKEVRGRGGANASIASSLEPAGDGTRVTVVTELSLRGAVAQYGRPVVGSVAEELTNQFATCLASMLETAPFTPSRRQAGRRTAPAVRDALASPFRRR
jgi:carbon monoxide dehydrogenase subunit G